MNTNPYIVLQELIEKENLQSKSDTGYNCCLSTVDKNGFPSGRIITIKNVTDNHLIFTSSTKSQKVDNISFNNVVALTFWFPSSKNQIRVNGFVKPCESKISASYFKNRSLESQIVSTIFDQRKSAESFREIEKSFIAAKKEIDKSRTQKVKRPTHWSAFIMLGSKFEFFTFHYNRLHQRLIYERVENNWKTYYLEP